MSVAGAVLRFVRELVGLGINAAGDVLATKARTERREKAQARSAARDADMLQRFARNPLCTCGHALSAHRFTGDCTGCSCPAFVQHDA